MEMWSFSCELLVVNECVLNVTFWSAVNVLQQAIICLCVHSKRRRIITVMAHT